MADALLEALQERMPELAHALTASVPAATRALDKAEEWLARVRSSAAFVVDVHNLRTTSVTSLWRLLSVTLCDWRCLRHLEAWCHR